MTKKLKMKWKKLTNALLSTPSATSSSKLASTMTVMLKMKKITLRHFTTRKSIALESKLHSNITVCKSVVQFMQKNNDDKCPATRSLFG